MRARICSFDKRDMDEDCVGGFAGYVVALNSQIVRCAWSVADFRDDVMQKHFYSRPESACAFDSTRHRNPRRGGR